jgi:hypothetical protein
MADCPKCASPMEEDNIVVLGNPVFRQQCTDCDYVKLQVLA